MKDIQISHSGTGILIEIPQISEDQVDEIYRAVEASGISESPTILFSAKISALCDALKWAAVDEPEPGALAALASGWGFNESADITIGHSEEDDDADEEDTNQIV